MPTEGRAMPTAGGVVSPLDTQVSFVGATMPRGLDNILADVVPVMEFLLLVFCINLAIFIEKHYTICVEYAAVMTTDAVLLISYVC